jgi:thioredoxin 1
MSTREKATIVLALALAIATVLYVKHARAPVSAGAEAPRIGLPRLVEFGAGWCTPCRLMEPIIEDLRTAYAGRLQVEYIDITKDTGAPEKFQLAGIPTQVFFDAAGNELYRHAGFIAKEDIVEMWKELGFLKD